MNKNVIIWVLVVLLATSAGAAFYFSTQGPVLVVGESNKAVCDTLPLYTGSLGGSGSGSNGVPYIAQDICHTVFAVEKNDASICNKIKTPELKGGCYSEVANKKGDVSICDAAPADARDSCYAKMVERMGNVATCEKIQRQDDRDNCLQSFASRNNDASVCKKITNINRRDSCYMNLAYNNPSLCNEVMTPQMRQDCQRNAQRR